jgi:CDP-6-deoxy-D-xylo-4-hexulose-3-dehydrase
MYTEKGLNREKVVKFLEEKKIGTRMLFAGNLLKQPAYANAHYKIHGELNNTDLIMTNLFWIGVHPALTREQMTYMLEQLEKATRL